MGVRALSAGPERRHAIAVPVPMAKSLKGFLTSVAGFGVKAMTKANGALRSLQMGRMMAILSNMSDQQLAQIGVTRPDIPQYAKELITKD